jgi:hypothetical protein
MAGDGGRDEVYVYRLSGQQVQRINVMRPDDGEMTAVQRRHIGQPKPFGNCDNRGISGSQRKALIGTHQVGHPRVVSARQVDGVKSPSARDRRNNDSTRAPASRARR